MIFSSVQHWQPSLSSLEQVLKIIYHYIISVTASINFYK